MTDDLFGNEVRIAVIGAACVEPAFNVAHAKAGSTAAKKVTILPVGGRA